jgi:DNA-binding transcriptional regulator YiaG
MTQLLNIVELAKQCPDFTINVKVSDLIEANKKLIKDVYTSLEDEVKAAKEEKYLSRNEVAEMLNVTLPTLWRWEKMEYLVPVRMGGKLLYKLSEVKAIINQKKK